MGSGVDPAMAMDRKIPTMLWKTQLLKLVSEAPKAACVECTELGYQRFPSSSSTTSAEDNESDQSNQSLGSVSLNDFTVNQIQIQQNGKSDRLLRNNKDDHEQKLLDSLAALELSLQMVEVDSSTNTDSISHSNSPSPLGSNSDGITNRIPNGGGGKTAAAPWHRPSIYLFNPFAKAFHGYLSHSEVKRLLSQDGHFLVRKRDKDADDEFILSFRFHGHIKNFVITFEETSGLIYVGEKGYESLSALVQEGLTTMHLEHKAGSYIDLMCDLTRYNNQFPRQLHRGGCIRTDSPTVASHQGHLFAMSQRNVTKQSSPSPSLSRTSIERVRRPELKSHSLKTHTFQELSKCHVCLNFLWGLSSQGLLCQHCGLILHESCVERVTTDCEPRLAELPSIFGVDLTILVKATGGAPFVLQKCVTEIEKRGLHIEGIYRVSGSREATERLRTLFEHERELADLSGHLDMHSMCGAVKQFLRLLPEPLITKEVFQRFLNVIANNGGGTNLVSVEVVRRELKRLPPAHLVTVKFLLQHLHRVAEESERNKMNPFNLSSVFAPSVLCPSQITMETLKTGTSLLELMITQARNLFPR